MQLMSIPIYLAAISHRISLLNILRDLLPQLQPLTEPPAPSAAMKLSNRALPAPAPPLQPAPGCGDVALSQNQMNNARVSTEIPSRAQAARCGDRLDRAA